MSIKIYEQQVQNQALPGVRQRIRPSSQGGQQIGQSIAGLAGPISEVAAAVGRVRTKQDNAVGMGFGARKNETD